MRAVAAAAVVAVLAVGCGSSQSLSEEQMTAFVNAQAHALCVVQSNAYPTQADQEAAYQKALSSSNLDEKDLAKARKVVQQDAATRARVSNQVAALCG